MGHGADYGEPDPTTRPPGVISHCSPSSGGTRVLRTWARGFPLMSCLWASRTKPCAMVPAPFNLFRFRHASGVFRSLQARSRQELGPITDIVETATPKREYLGSFQITCHRIGFHKNVLTNRQSDVSLPCTHGGSLRLPHQTRLPRLAARNAAESVSFARHCAYQVRRRRLLSASHVSACNTVANPHVRLDSACGFLKCFDDKR